MAKRWTKQEDEILVKLIEKGKLPNAISEVSTSLGRTEKAVYARYCSLKKNTNPTSKRNFYTEEENKIILDYITNSKNTTIQELCNQLNRSRNSIKVKIYKLRKQHPELKIRKIETETLKQVLVNV